jgi:PhnB protein
MAKETPGQDAEIKAVIDAWAQAIRAKDAAGVVAHQAADFVQFDLAPPLQTVGKDPQGLRDWFATWQGHIGYEIVDQHMTVGDELAFTYSLVHLTGNHSDGSDSDVWFRNTLCLRKIDNAWKIAHGHESVPMYMDGSLKAAVDLKP